MTVQRYNKKITYANFFALFWLANTIAMCMRLLICGCVYALSDFNNKIIITKISTHFHGRARVRDQLENMCRHLYAPENMWVCTRSLLDFNNKIIITKNGTHGGEKDQKIQSSKTSGFVIRSNCPFPETPRKNKHPASPSRNRGMGVIKKRITNQMCSILIISIRLGSLSISR